MIRSKEELDKMRKAGKVVAEIHEVTRAAIRPGVTTMDLNDAGGRGAGQAQRPFELLELPRLSRGHLHQS